MSLPFDAVLLISFGGPLGRDDIRPFLQNVLRGRRIPPERLEEVVHHYERFDGVSPITDITFRQARGLEARLRARGVPLPVHVGMRNWRPLIVETLRETSARGVRRILGVIAAAHRSYSSCEQYKQNVWQAQEELRAAGVTPPDIVYAGDWHLSAGFVEAVADRVRTAQAELSGQQRAGARLVFSAHSIPVAMPGARRYERQLRESAEAVARRLGIAEWDLVYQSRSGRPEDPWLEPDVNDHLRARRAAGDEAIVLSPIGFVADHIEVLYDLDVEARETCREMGLTLARAQAVNDHPAFIDALADAVLRVVERYRAGIPLTVLPTSPPSRRELPPPVRP